MDIINANLTRMHYITVLGIPALFTPHKVSRNTVHLGLYCYDLKRNENSSDYPMIIADEVPDAECIGTLITNAPMFMNNIHKLSLMPGDIVYDINPSLYTPVEFERLQKSNIPHLDIT